MIKKKCKFYTNGSASSEIRWLYDEVRTIWTRYQEPVWLKIAAAACPGISMAVWMSRKVRDDSTESVKKADGKI